MNVKRILFPTDFSPCADAALSHAIFHAEISSSELHIIHAVHWEDQNPITRLPNADNIMFEMQKVGRLHLDEMLKPHKEVPFSIVEKCIVGDSATQVIMDYIQEKNIGMVVMGTHGRRGISHFLLGSAAEEIARMAPCPVLTVREDSKKSSLGPIKKVLAPVDYSVQSKHAVYQARELAAVMNAELTLLNVVQEFENSFSSVDAGFSLMNDIMPKVVEEQKKNLENFYNDIAGPTVPVHFEVQVGRPAWRINDYAKKNDMDYIVMGTHGFTGFNHLVLGSTTERVIRMAPCPVYSLKIRN